MRTRVHTPPRRCSPLSVCIRCKGWRKETRGGNGGRIPACNPVGIAGAITSPAPKFRARFPTTQHTHTCIAGGGHNLQVPPLQSFASKFWYKSWTTWKASQEEWDLRHLPSNNPFQCVSRMTNSWPGKMNSPSFNKARQGARLLNLHFPSACKL